ncbi:hypothetical protein [Sphingomonas yabuuchiae]|uniref:hypothetical protein n=1 Tax=Sphingomonas yabuuchiae TaxID=172044 RepID=UPI003D95396B
MIVAVNIMAVGGFVLALLAFAGAYFAGSDAARISGHSNLLLAAAGSLLISALLLELHA